jgi:hypothetical protein
MSNKVFAGEARLRLNSFGAARDVVSGMSISVPSEGQSILAGESPVMVETRAM